MANTTINKVIRPSTSWEKIFATYITEQGPICHYVSKLKIEGKGGKKTKKNWQKTGTGNLKCVCENEKIFNLTHKRKAN